MSGPDSAAHASGDKENSGALGGGDPVVPPAGPADTAETDSVPPSKKREGWLGTIITGILCLGFLYWWFRPSKPAWEHQSTPQYVSRALAEPAAPDATARLVLDFDLMETALLQARQGMAPEGAETAMHIADPVIQARAIRQLAQAHLNNDPKRMGDALAMCGRIADPAARGRMREEILLQIAALGFPDVALPEANSLLLRARLARRMAETDGQEMARGILKEIDTAVPTLPPDQAAALRTEAAQTRIGLTLTDGPEQAFPAINALPAAEQDDLWLELFRICFGLGDDAGRQAAAVAAQIQNPALKRKMELEALESNMPLRPAPEILSELQTELKAAAPGVPRIHALMALADAQRRVTGPEAEEAPASLRLAFNAALALPDPIQRATLLAELSDVLPDSLLLSETSEALTAAASAARTVVAPAERLPVLIAVLRQAFNSGELKLAAELASEASAIAGSSPLSPDSLKELADFLVRIGDWNAGLQLLSKAADPAARAALLDELATTVAEETIGYDATQPPSRGEPFDRIRNRAVTDETGAALWTQQVPAGQPRARAWLAAAKGQLLAPGALPLAVPESPLPGSSNDIPMDSQDPLAAPPPEAGESNATPSAPDAPGPAEAAAPVNSDPAPPVLPAPEPEPPLPQK